MKNRQKGGVGPKKKKNTLGDARKRTKISLYFSFPLAHIIFYVHSPSTFPGLSLSPVSSLLEKALFRGP